MPLHHLRVEMAGAPGDNLLYGKAELCQSLRVVLGLQIASEHRDARTLVHAVQSLLQQQRLARSRRTDEVHAQDPLLAIALAQLLGENLVLIQDFLFNFHSAHSSTSMYAMSNSSPLMHWVANSPHFGHSGSKSVMRNSCRHLGHRCTRGIASTSSTRPSH